MAFYMRSPVYTPNDPVKSVKQLHSWLYQLNENLKFMFSNLDGDNFTSEFSACFSEEAAQKTQAEIKKLDEAIERMGQMGAWEKPDLTGFTPVSEETAPAYLNAGSCVHSAGEVRNTDLLPANAQRKMFSLPKDLCPRKKQMFLCRSDARVLSVIVDTNGDVSVCNPESEPVNQNSVIVFSFSCGL